MCGDADVPPVAKAFVDSFLIFIDTNINEEIAKTVRFVDAQSSVRTFQSFN